ncbi:HAD-IIIC family phosphatase [Magnetococcus sp. PR-3]|uniref:HAD-IIIC family phosphatase n=1 Tax=Magnetococcus sp. PR-3 TaxID=3120355 RepID=UPI002FCE5043
MSKTALTLISDFNTSVLARLLNHGQNQNCMEAKLTPFGQVYQTLAAAPEQGDALVMVWCRPEGVLPSFADGLDFEPVDEAALEKEVNRFAQLLLNHAAQVKHLFVASWVMPPAERGYGMLDWRPGIGLRYMLSKANLQLADRLAKAPNIHLLDAQSWLQVAGPKAASPRMGYATKTPYGNGVLEAAAKDILAAVDGLQGAARRLVLVDLDDTMWGGIIGETGWEGIRLGGHDHAGEAFQDFQRALKGLIKRGILVGVVSKNTEEVALAAFDNHPEMVLKKTDLAGWRINWMDKAQNVADLTKEINLGLKSVVFIDDNPAERGRVREALPEVLVPEWPKQPTEYATFLRAMDCFEIPALSGEDRKRAEMIRAERARQEAKEDVGSHGDWLGTLDMQVVLSPITKANLPRIEQLFNKTNQMNMATRRLSEQEISQWAEHTDHHLLAASVSDRFGASGLTGIMAVALEGEQAVLTDLILSCRVMGRQIEHLLMAQAVAWATAQGAKQLVARYLPTPRNAPCLTYLRHSGLVEISEHLFSWDCHQPYPQPAHLSVEVQPHAQG